MRSTNATTCSRICALFVAALAAGTGFVSPARGAGEVWVATGSLNVPRAGHAAVLLPSNKVLVAGGSGTSAEIYDPATGQFTLTGALGVPRSDPKATLLNTGQVLVIGGDSTGPSPYSLGFGGTCELYDPATGRWTSTGTLNTPRDGFTATLLPDGEVLVAGGVSNADEALDSAELYDPFKGTWRYTGSFGGARFDHAAARLADGKVLIVGGSNDDLFLAAIGGASVYDAGTGVWTNMAELSTPRAQLTATLLGSGNVLVAGGFGSPSVAHAQLDHVSYALADLFDPIAGWTPTGQMNAKRFGHTATLLANGRVLVTGGNDLNTSTELASAELYDPATGAWQTTASMRDARAGHTGTRLADGRVLVVGGVAQPGTAPLASAELFEASTAPAGTITAGFTGAWYDPAQSGHGLFVEVLPNNRLQALWFAFDPSGQQQAWFTGVGTYSGNTATISNVLLPTGGRFIPDFDPTKVIARQWGSLTFTFTDCNHGRVAFSSTDGYGSGSMNITRLTLPAGLVCP